MDDAHGDTEAPEHDQHADRYPGHAAGRERVVAGEREDRHEDRHQPEDAGQQHHDHRAQSLGDAEQAGGGEASDQAGENGERVETDAVGGREPVALRGGELDGEDGGAAERQQREGLVQAGAELGTADRQHETEPGAGVEIA